MQDRKMGDQFHIEIWIERKRKSVALHLSSIILCWSVLIILSLPYSYLRIQLKQLLIEI